MLSYDLCIVNFVCYLVLFRLLSIETFSCVIKGNVPVKKRPSLAVHSFRDTVVSAQYW